MGCAKSNGQCCAEIRHNVRFGLKHGTSRANGLHFLPRNTRNIERLQSIEPSVWVVFASKVLTRDDLEDESQEAEICRFLLKYAETLICIAKRKMMFGAEDNPNIEYGQKFPPCKAESFQIFVTVEFPYTLSFSWLFFRVAIPCAGVSFKTHCMSSAKPMNINGELMVIDAGSK